MKQILFIWLLLSFHLTTRAQLQQYTFRHESGLFTEIEGYNVPYTKHTVADDTIGPEKVDLPFSFRFGNTTADSIGISENGFVWFGTAPGSSFFWPPFIGPLPPDVTGVIVALGPDLHPHYYSTLNTQVKSAVVGAAPNRLFIVEWRNTSRIEPLDLASAEDTLSFQIKLYETTNRIEIVYGDFRVHESATTYPKVGLRGPETGNYSLRMGSWQQTVAGSLSGYLTLDRISKPSFGQLFVWEPPVATSVPEKSIAMNVTVYPVPAANVLHVAGSKWENAAYTVYDVTGRKWNNGTLKGQAIPVHNLAAGNYFLELKHNHLISRAPFMKQ